MSYTKKCSYCGKENNGSATFCKSCGKSLTSGNYGGFKTAEDKKGGNGLLIGGIAAGLTTLAVIGIIGGVLIFGKGGDAGKTNPSAQQNTSSTSHLTVSSQSTEHVEKQEATTQNFKETKKSYSPSNPTTGTTANTKNHKTKKTKKHKEKKVAKSDSNNQGSSTIVNQINGYYSDDNSDTGISENDSYVSNDSNPVTQQPEQNYDNNAVHTEENYDQNEISVQEENRADAPDIHVEEENRADAPDIHVEEENRADAPDIHVEEENRADASDMNVQEENTADAQTPQNIADGYKEVKVTETVSYQYKENLFLQKEEEEASVIYSSADDADHTCMIFQKEESASSDAFENVTNCHDAVAMELNQEVDDFDDNIMEADDNGWASAYIEGQEVDGEQRVFYTVISNGQETYSIRYQCDAKDAKAQQEMIQNMVEFHFE